mmetsp:Transcript_2191/g.3285  ORF Transcript_2191/g.3285 Transcript_2191/m.3285 type:complete len:94 (-) Transcript_2191:30-311(-)
MDYALTQVDSLLFTPEHNQTGLHKTLGDMFGMQTYEMDAGTVILIVILVLIIVAILVCICCCCCACCIAHQVAEKEKEKEEMEKQKKMEEMMM